MHIERSRRRVRAVRVVATAVLCAALSVALASAPTTARANERGDYLAKLALVLDGLRRTLIWVEMNPTNHELARFAHGLSEAYVQMAGRMTPPGELRMVHPHLVIVAENTERAVAAAAEEDVRTMRSRARTVREELRTLEGILEHLRMRLPQIPR